MTFLLALEPGEKSSDKKLTRGYAKDPTRDPVKIMRCPTLNELPSPPQGKTGWPWTEESPQAPDAMPSGPPCPRISIITPSYNQGQFIEEAIRSVLLQGYPDLEFLVIDGRSSDNTLEIIKKYDPWLAYWVSEPDRGQSHAVNKGFRMATGDIIGWLNSDDGYWPGTFHKVHAVFSNDRQLDFVFSNCIFVDANDHIVGFFQGKNPQEYDVFHNRNFIPQPTVFFRNNIFRETGYLNEEYFMSMDLDYWRRISRNHKMEYVNDVFACFRTHDECKTAKYTKRFKCESKVSFFRNGGSVFSPYYFETFIRPKLMKIFIHNPIIKMLFYRNR